MRMRPANDRSVHTGIERPQAEPLDESRRELAARYVPLAISIARKFSSNWYWLRDEMESAALVALVEAARTFDPGRNVRFPTFLRKRLYGALLDTRRQMCQSAMRWDDRDMDDATDWVRTKTFSNLSAEEVVDFEERIIDGSGYGDHAAMHDIQDQLRTEFRHLPSRHREVMDGIYLRNLTFDDLADSLGCSKTRLIAVHRESIDLLIETNRKMAPRSRRRRVTPAFPRKTEPNRESY